MRNFVTAISVTVAAVAFAQPVAPAPSIWERDTLTGDWGGLRTEWAEKGVDLTLEYTAESFGVVSGGTSRGADYNGLGYGALDADLEKIIGWRGFSFRISTMWTHGASPGKHAGNELAISNIDAFDGLRLHELYLEKEYGDLHVKLGSLLADGDFVPSMYRETLINDAFGQTASWSANTLNGGPAFTAAGLGIHLRYDLSEAAYVQAGVYDGDIFDDSGGDPTINQHGTHFELGNGQGWTSLYQIGYNGFNVSDGTDLPAWYRLGVWHHSGTFDKNAAGTVDGNSGIFFSLDKLLYREDGDQGLGGFFRYGVAKRDRSRIHTMLDAGLSYTGLIPGRDEDITTLGFLHAKHSGDITTTKSHESLLELTHRIQVSPSVYIQPDIQWINRPSGDNSVNDVLAIGLRVGFTF